MIVTWYGAAGFRIEGEAACSGRVFLIDPYLGHSARAHAYAYDVGGASGIFVSHGHFDHMASVPRIARQTGATVYCSPRARQALRRQGVRDAQLVAARDGDCFDRGAYAARCFNSTHVRFDLPLILKTLLRSIPSIPRQIWRLGRLRHWPQGQVLSWRFRLPGEGGRIIQHFGSAGWTEMELTRLTALDAPDVLLLPLQGHSRICHIAAHVVERLGPRLVVPHHHDDFYPPLSRAVDILPFVEAVRSRCPTTEVVVPTLGRSVAL